MKALPPVRRLLRCAPLALIVLPVLGAGTAAASTSEIEGVWSFGGGAVAIQGLPGGTFQGTVVTPTTFASCPHPAGQVMWTEMRAQPDGSYWGLHKWFRGTECREEPGLVGHTAWRVLQTVTGAKYLKVCFDTPGEEVQPKIAPGGQEEDVTYGCQDSNPLAPLSKVEGEAGTGTGPGGGGPGSSNETPGSGSPGGNGSVITFGKTVVLPYTKACYRQRSLKIALRNPKYDPLAQVVVKINGRRVADVKGVKLLAKGVTLKKLPTGNFKVSVVATTVLNQHLSGSRSYKSCTKGSGKIKLRRIKKHHHRHS